MAWWVPSRDAFTRNATFCYLGENQLVHWKFRLGALSAAELLTQPVGCSVLNNCMLLPAENRGLLDWQSDHADLCFPLQRSRKQLDPHAVLLAFQTALRASDGIISRTSQPLGNTSVQREPGCHSVWEFQCCCFGMQRGFCWWKQTYASFKEVTKCFYV